MGIGFFVFAIKDMGKLLHLCFTPVRQLKILDPTLGHWPSVLWDGKFIF